MVYSGKLLQNKPACSSEVDNDITDRIQGFISGKNAAGKPIHVAELTAQTSPVVLRGVECGEQNDCAASGG